MPIALDTGIAAPRRGLRSTRHHVHHCCDRNSPLTQSVPHPAFTTHRQLAIALRKCKPLLRLAPATCLVILHAPRCAVVLRPPAPPVREKPHLPPPATGQRQVLRV